ncbi:MAG: hypothetical protein ACAI44_05145 [Candidatus Sericytochromatia bacterium]
MTDLPINPQLVARSYDTNRDCKVSDNLKVKQDADTLRALGGDADVTVDELANALKNDNVIIRNGEIQANPKVTLRVPLQLDGYSRAQSLAREAYFSANTYAKAPDKVPSSRSDGDTYERESFNRQIEELDVAENDVRFKAFRSMMELQKQANELKDPQLDALLENVSNAINQVVDYPDTNNPQLNQLIHARGQMSHIRYIQGAFKTVSDYLDKFEQPLSSARSANNAINSAQKEVDRERQAVANKGKAVNQLNTEIKEIQDSYNPFFRETRMDSRKEQIKTINSQVDSYSVNSRQEKLEKLARQNYENVVSALDGYSFKEGSDIKASTRNIVSDAAAIAKAADKNADIVEDALD